MELPQPSAFGTEARKATHDFLSLYSHSPVPQDPRPSHGRFIKTHNFLQPLETEEKRSPKEDNSIEINIERPPLPVSPPSVERILPGGIGTYSISRISYLNQRVPKPEDPVFTAAPASSNNNDDNSNCSSYSGSAFTMWDESATRKGKTGQENLSNVNLVKEPTAKAGKWPLDRPSQSAFDYRSTFSSPSSSQPATQQKSQSFMEMIESAKGPHSREDDDEEDVMLKKESSSQKGELRSRVDGKGNDQKANTSRSKHSATEQRRRCKINDRFQMLRELIPHSDQKRDKASFLLEVIEYIQFLQEKVLRYEGSYPGWNHEPAKLTPWRNSHRPTESFADQAQRVNGATSSVLMFGARLEEKSTAISLNMPQDSKLPLESNINNTISFKTMDQNSGLINKAVPISTPLQPDIFPPIRNGSMTPSTSRLPSYVNNASTPQVKLWQSRACASDSIGAKDKLKEQDLAVEGGTINISSMYSQGLLNTLTQALQSSGVDLSQANISVQVDIGKRANSRQNAHQPMDMDEIPISSQSHLHGRIESNRGRESDQAHKRLKTG